MNQKGRLALSVPLDRALRWLAARVKVIECFQHFIRLLNPRISCVWAASPYWIIWGKCTVYLSCDYGSASRPITEEEICDVDFSNSAS